MAIESPSGGTIVGKVEWFNPVTAMQCCRELIGSSVRTTELHTAPLVVTIEAKLGPWQGALRGSDRLWRELSGHRKGYSVVYDAVQVFKEGASAGFVNLNPYPQEPLPHWINMLNYPTRISIDLL